MGWHIHLATTNTPDQTAEEMGRPSAQSVVARPLKQDLLASGPQFPGDDGFDRGVDPLRFRLELD
jgi:hypothetical protein